MRKYTLDEFVELMELHGENPIIQYKEPLPPPEKINGINKGERNSLLHSYATKYVYEGLEAAERFRKLQELNEEKCHPPLDDEELLRINRSVNDYPRQKAKKIEKELEPVEHYVPHPLVQKCTDVGNSLRLIHRHGKGIRFCPELNDFFTWNGRIWEKGEAPVIERAKETAQKITEEAALISDKDERKRLFNWALRSEERGKINNMIKLTESVPEVRIKEKDLDSNPNLIGAQNGTIDLKTGTLMCHNRDHFITKETQVTHMAGAECPQFISFLDNIFQGNQEIIKFVQKAAGYSLTGSTNERCVFILHGSGKNGKSTLVNTLRYVIGDDYAATTPIETLMVKQYGEGIPNDIAGLRGKRFVSASEAEQGKRLAESLLKSLTGGEPISARFLRAEFFEFIPQFKIWLSTNHKPVIKGTDEAIWDRVRLIPFNVRIPDEEVDEELGEKLKSEAPGILNWMVEGCMKWREEGLKKPQEVDDAINEYRREMDVIGDFLECCCVFGEGLSASISDVFNRYQDHTGMKNVTKIAFGRLLEERGFTKKKGNLGRREWQGLALIEENESEGMPF